MTVPEAIGRLFPESRRLPSGVWAVGGVIRDLLLDLEPVDLDLACIDAAGVARHFTKLVSGTLVDLGRERFPTFRVISNGRVFDFSELTDGSIAADLARRDFTINSMALDLVTGHLLDLHGGAADLHAGVVRMVREQNLVDDPLRILKAIRTACTLGFDIEASTLEALQRHRELVGGVAGERLRSELMRAVDSERSSLAIHLLREIALDEILFGSGLATEDTESRCDGLPGGNHLPVLALLFRPLDSQKIAEIALRLRFSQEETRALAVMRSLSIAAHADDDGSLRLAMYDAGPEVVAMAEELLGRSGPASLVERLHLLRSAPGFFDTRSLLDGTEIAALLGTGPGPAVGRAKRALLAAQLGGRVAGRVEAIELMESLSKARRTEAGDVEPQE